MFTGKSILSRVLQPLLSPVKEHLTGVTGTKGGNRPGNLWLKYLTGIFIAISLAETYLNTFIGVFLDRRAG